MFLAFCYDANIAASAQAEISVKKSLNREQRRRQLIKITQENQAILRRLQAKNATYSVEKWEKEFAN